LDAIQVHSSNKNFMKDRLKINQQIRPFWSNWLRLQEKYFLNALYLNGFTSYNIEFKRISVH